MSSFGTPFEGRDAIAALLYITGNLDLRLYTNTKNSLTDTTVLADLTHPTGTGYATYTLSGSYAINNGIITYDDGTPDEVEFTNSGGTDWTGAVTGAAITDGTAVWHFRDFTSDPITLGPGETIAVDVSTLVS